MTTLPSELLRIDPLTGCKNYLGFLESLVSHTTSALKENRFSRETLIKSWVDSSHSSAILFIELNHIKLLNETRGRSYGDSVIHWMGILLQEETACEVYRLGGVEFAVLLKLDTRKQHEHLIECILHRIAHEARLLGFPDPPADIALVYLDQSPASIDTLLLRLAEAMVRVKNNGSTHFQSFEAIDFVIQPPLVPPGSQTVAQTSPSRSAGFRS